MRWLDMKSIHCGERNYYREDVLQLLLNVDNKVDNSLFLVTYPPVRQALPRIQVAVL